MSKQRKEALVAIMDGLDILVGMDKPEEKKEVEKEKAPDSFTGLLQSLIPLMIIPQLLPLFQQSLGQTLRDTTVNVKVESATSIIPIDITATTAIVPIEIRASQVTLNVNITGQETTLNVTISGDASVVITGQNIGVALTGTWQTFLGYNKVFWAEGQIPGCPYFDTKFIRIFVDYTVPSGRELYVESVNLNIVPRHTLDWYNVYGTGVGYPLEYLGFPTVEFIIEIGTSVVAKITLSGEQPSTTYQPQTPLKITAGSGLRIIGIGSPYGCWASVVVGGYEKTI